MKRYRIGKDVANRINVRTNGEYTPLAGRDISLQMTDPKGCKAWVDFTIVDDYKMLFVFYGKDQKHTGTYQLTVWENYGNVGQTVVDCIGAFRLVANTTLEGGEDPEGLDTEVNDLELDISTAEGGADGVGIASIEQTITSTEDGGINEVTQTLTDGTTAVFQIRNGSRGSQGVQGERGPQGIQGVQGETGPQGPAGADWIPTSAELDSIAANAASRVSVPDDLADLNDDSTHRLVTDVEKTTWNGKSNFSGSYNDLSDKPTIPTVPSNVSAFTNDSHYVASTAITNIVSLTQAAYDALATKDANTLYIIPES